MRLPKSVTEFLKRKGAEYHGVFQVVDSPEESARYYQAKAKVRPGRLITVISEGPNSTERKDYLVSEPWVFGGDKREVPTVVYDTNEEAA